jgi:hypothetical protein
MHHAQYQWWQQFLPLQTFGNAFPGGDVLCGCLQLKLDDAIAGTVGTGLQGVQQTDAGLQQQCKQSGDACKDMFA